MKERGVTFYALAAKVGMSDSGLKNSLRNNTLKISNLKNICTALQIDFKLMISYEFEETPTELQILISVINAQRQEIERLKSQLETK